MATKAEIQEIISKNNKEVVDQMSKALVNTMTPERVELELKIDQLTKQVQMLSDHVMQIKKQPQVRSTKATPADLPAVTLGATKPASINNYFATQYSSDPAFRGRYTPEALGADLKKLIAAAEAEFASLTHDKSKEDDAKSKKNTIELVRLARLIYKEMLNDEKKFGVVYTQYKAEHQMHKTAIEEAMKKDNRPPQKEEEKVSDEEAAQDKSLTHVSSDATQTMNDIDATIDALLPGAHVPVITPATAATPAKPKAAGRGRGGGAARGRGAAAAAK